jgi:hypothetical protein
MLFWSDTKPVVQAQLVKAREVAVTSRLESVRMQRTRWARAAVIPPFPFATCKMEVGVLGPVGTGLLHKGGARKYLGRTGKPEEAPTEVGAARCRY